MNTEGLSTLNSKAVKSLRTRTGYFVHAVGVGMLPVTQTKPDFFPALDDVGLVPSTLCGALLTPAYFREEAAEKRKGIFFLDLPPSIALGQLKVDTGCSLSPRRHVIC